VVDSRTEAEETNLRRSIELRYLYNLKFVIILFKLKADL